MPDESVDGDFICGKFFQQRFPNGRCARATLETDKPSCYPVCTTIHVHHMFTFYFSTPTLDVQKKYFEPQNHQFFAWKADKRKLLFPFHFIRFEYRANSNTLANYPEALSSAPLWILPLICIERTAIVTETGDHNGRQ